MSQRVIAVRYPLDPAGQRHRRGGGSVGDAQLPRDAQLEFKGELKGYLKHLDQEASNKKLKQAK